MLSYHLADIIRSIIREKYELDANILDTHGVIISSPDRKSINTIQANIARSIADYSDSLPDLIALKSDSETAGFVHFFQEIPRETLESIRAFTQALMRYNGERSKMDAVYHEETQLVSRLLSENASDYSLDIQTRAASLGYTITHPMSVVVVWFKPEYNYCLNINLGYESATHDVKMHILETIKNHPYLNRHDIVVFLDNNYFVILKAIEELNNLERLYLMQQRLEQMADEVFKTHRIFKYYVSAGRIAESFDQAWRSFGDASSNINIALLENIAHTIITPEDVMLSTMVTELSHEYKTLTIMPKIALLNQANKETVQGIIECFNCYINVGFSISRTADEMYLHRNTVKNRMEKLQALVGIDPMGSFEDILTIKLILRQYTLLNREGK